MTDYIDKKKELRRYFPASFYKIKDGQGLAILLDIIGQQLDDLEAQGKEARKQFILSTSTGAYLAAHGSNYDVFKPKGSNMLDSSYRNLIKIIANSPKNVEQCFERLLMLFFGINVFNRNYADVGSYQPGEILLRISRTALIVAISRTLKGTTYLHTTHDAWTGDPVEEWSGTVIGPYAAGVTEMEMPSVPTGMPSIGVLHIGDESTSNFEVKGFYRTGTTITFLSPTYRSQPAGAPIVGAKFPNNYPSGYVYDATVSSSVSGFLPAGSSILNMLIGYDKFPDSGVIYIGEIDSGTLEAKGYSRTGSVFTLEGVTSYLHNSGEMVSIPIFPRKIKTTITSGVSAGDTESSLDVTNAADFPLDWAAIVINRGYDNAELVPFRGRVVGDNTKMNIDPAYVFKYDHSPSETIHLMARQIVLGTMGEQYPFYLVDSASLRDQFLSIIKRVKVAGVRLTIEYF